jgi:hypothetical protein
MGRGLELLLEEESKLKQDLSEIRADIAKLQGSRTGRPKAKKEHGGISDKVARQVAERIRSLNGKGTSIKAILDSDDWELSASATRYGANKAVDIFPDIIRYKEIDGREFHYKAKQETV